MKKSLKFFFVFLLLVSGGGVFSADDPHLNQDDLDRHNAVLRDRLASLRADSPCAMQEIKELEMQLKVGGLWPESKSLVGTVLKRRSSLIVAIDREKAKLMPACRRVEEFYAQLISQFEMRIIAQNKLEEMTKGLAIGHEAGASGTCFGVLRGHLCGQMF
ncbi:MAG: hypothetical protein NT128_04570 [Proteobacteria bacterium]|nr:hypothetical protein [Pseudomonadota bacterium]